MRDIWNPMRTFLISGTKGAKIVLGVSIFIQNFVSSSYYCSYYNYFHYNFLDY